MGFAMNIAVALVGITRCYPAMTASKGVANGLPLGGLATIGNQKNTVNEEAPVTAQ